VSEQLTNHDHRFGKIAAKMTHRDSEELLHLADATKSADRHDRVKVFTTQAKAVPAMQDRLDRQRLVVIWKIKPLIRD